MTATNAREVNFDGLVGPTHNYGGLSDGNLASMNNLGDVSNPREAALQGVAKMRRLLALGLTQGVLLPHERPHMPTLKAFGFTGSDAEILQRAAYAPGLARPRQGTFVLLATVLCQAAASLALASMKRAVSQKVLLATVL